MFRAIAIGLVAAVVTGCGSTATQSVAPLAPAPSAVSAAPADLSPGASTVAPTPTAAPSSTPEPTATPVALLGNAATKPVDAATAGRLQAAVDKEVADGAPDLIAAVITADGTWAGAEGVDGPNGRKAEATDEFGIASVSKMLLSALILKLADDGKIDLDAPLADYLDGVDVDANGATVRQALAMRSGIGGTPDGVIEKALAACDRPWTTEDIMTTIPAPFGAADSRYEYSNPTYKLVGVAAENASGKKLADALKALVIDPRDGDRLLLQGRHAAPPKPWALPLEGHTNGLDLARFGTGGNLPCVGFSTLAWGASGVASDAPTLARWGWNLFAGKVISADCLQDMVTTDTNGHGLGIDRFRDFPHDVAYGHAGSQAGYAALLTILPERRAVIVVFINEEAADPFARASHLIDALDG